jgi:succinate dehydrogenase/fumarate reductase cytochrome b subunit
MQHQKKLWLLPLLLLLLSTLASAQPGLDEMQQAQQSLTSSFFSAMDFALVLAALFGIIGAVRVYHNWQMGHPRIDQQVAAWFFAALFMVLMGAFLQAIFGI